jgi:hypothetical protein
MGLGFSPILFVIGLHYILTKEGISNMYLQYRSYADDCSIYFTLQGLYILITKQGKSLFWILKELINGRNLIISLLNNNPAFKKAGLKLDLRKSRIVRLCGI